MSLSQYTTLIFGTLGLLIGLPLSIMVLKRSRHDLSNRVLGIYLLGLYAGYHIAGMWVALAADSYTWAYRGFQLAMISLIISPVRYNPFSHPIHIQDY